jgi:hypothetical protein
VSEETRTVILGMRFQIVEGGKRKIIPAGTSYPVPVRLLAKIPQLEQGGQAPAPKPATLETALDGMTADQLREHAELNGVELKARDTKPQIIEKILAAQAVKITDPPGPPKE